MILGQGLGDMKQRGCCFVLYRALLEGNDDFSSGSAVPWFSLVLCSFGCVLSIECVC